MLCAAPPRISITWQKSTCSTPSRSSSPTTSTILPVSAGDTVRPEVLLLTQQYPHLPALKAGGLCSLLDKCGVAILPSCVSGLISRLKYPVSQHQRSAPSTAGLGYGKLASRFPGCSTDFLRLGSCLSHATKAHSLPRNHFPTLTGPLVTVLTKRCHKLLCSPSLGGTSLRFHGFWGCFVRQQMLVSSSWVC